MRERKVHLCEDLRADVLAPAFQLAVLDAAASRRMTRDEAIAYRMTGSTSIDELAQSIDDAVNNSAGPAGSP
ncbi:hypothetical protein Mal4_11280 [Maioricimonas rarisocia]|uniref:Uncharacterized protein n=1 Tax=Maioricimonas rarisocia TaxID=2528026 RepID=A0A517Z2X3_9PLAN|nr:hypothetical protein [Maioricimonas rarisocia]QDU36829.1 hypothetical protein Mal4_11280 [Maioricimonas rarisocia]